MRIFLKLFYTVTLALLCNVLVKVHPILAQVGSDSLKIEQVPDSLLTGIKFYSINSPSITSSIPLGTNRRKRLYGFQLGFDNTSITWDTLSTYKISRTMYNRTVYKPTVVDFNEFANLIKQQQKRDIQSLLVEESKSQEETGRGLLDFKINVPGGENSAFTTIFGTNEVNLRVNGSANMNVGASIQKLDDGTLPPDLRTRIDPTFNQNLQLNIQGTIGDKLTIATDWDTERQFDFENRLSIVYRGYEDEIIKSIEMGNVSMETGNSLVSGGKSLFGIKAVSELGPLKVTSVVSQQRGKNDSKTISGGSQETEIDLNPADYEDGRHFFLDFFNRSVFEQALADPQNILQPYQVTELYVYVRKATDIVQDENAIPAIALLDLGVNEFPGGLPGNEFDRFDQENLDALRSTESTATNDDFDATSQEYVDASFELLEEGIDFTFNRALGFISMRTYINSGDAIAVAYVYTDPNTGAPVEVGEFPSKVSEGDRLYLKLLRPGGMTTTDKAWPLTMRNIYSLGVSGITPDGFELEIADTRANIPVISLPERNQTLLEDLGLDRVNSEGAIGSDNIVDFTGITIDASTGRLMFPYLEPFGDRIISLLDGVVADTVRNTYAFTELYDIKQTDARVNSKNGNYTISGLSSGGVSGSFTLGFGLVEGSVKVLANNVELTEGSDYEVDYSFGSLNILNDKYLAPGQEIEVEFENNQFSIIGQKNFTGVRAEYTVNEDIKIGSTFFKLSEQPLSDKIRIGNEPINNTVLGMDAKAQFDTPWITRFIDRIPLLQTKTPSNFTFTGEFAQIRPGVAQTNAVQEAIDNGDLFRDEENGLVFIDDFEGAEYSISFLNPTRWNLASAPAAIPGYDDSYFMDANNSAPQTITDKKARADLRSQFSWYSIPRNIESVSSSDVTEESRAIRIDEVFQGREIINASDAILTPLDIYYNPNQRGPYNYNRDLKTFLENEPDRMWGGMTAVIPPGQEDLVQNNIEFLEFWVQPVLPGGQDGMGEEQFYEGKIYLDLGIISEDVVPNVRLNTEDGLATVLKNLTEDDPEGDPRSYIPPSPPVPLGQFSNSNRQLEDVGLDGAPNPGTAGAEGRDESSLFSEFIQSIRDSYGDGSEMATKVEADPSNDDYVYYGERQVRELKLNERFHRMLGYHDGNTPESSANSDKTAITLRPDTEGLVSSSSIQQSNSYFQYEIDFNPADRTQLQIGSEGTYIVDKVTPASSELRSWYLVRIPLTDFKRKFGEVESFQNISYMRLWMSGYEKPFTLRFATFEFIGSQWKKVTELTETPANQDNFKISTINIEENASREPFPYRQPDGSIRALNRGAQVQALQNEQSLVLSVDDLGPEEIQMVKRVYPGKLNLLNYSNVRMFVHGEGFQNTGDAELVVRFGTDLENNFYEYRQPVTPSESRSFVYDINNQSQLSEEAQEIWRYDENSMNIIISAFNVLKQLRDEENADPADLFERAGLLGEDAVPGSVLAIRGNPSLDRVSEIGLGIRNPYDPMDTETSGTPSLDAELWLNELRVSGFDNEFGWAANAKSSVKLADFATVNANVTRRTNGFGGLDSRLGERSVSDQLGYGLSTTVNLHKLIPDRFGWNFPISISNRRSTQTPKYLPDQGDIRLTDFEDAVNSNDELTSSERTSIINNKISDIQTVSENFSFNMSNISKKGSNSKLAQFTIDNLRLSYVFNKGYSKNPQLIFQNKWDYKASVQYNLRFQRVKLFRPFAFTEDVPVAKVLSGLRLGYLPSSISTSTTFSRRYDESRRRNLSDPRSLQSLNQQHAFTQQNNFTLNYTLTPSIPITFSNSTSFDLSSAGIKNRDVSGVDSTSFDLVPTFEVLKGVATDSLSARRSTYSERFSASWRPDISKIEALNWLTYSTSYGGGYQWNNSPRGSSLGASVSNNFQLDNSIRVNTERIFNKLGIFTRIKEANTKETNTRKAQKEKRKKEIENEVADSLRSPTPSPDLFKDLNYIGRKVFLSIFSMKDLSASYKRTKSGSQPGYSGASQIYYAFNNAGSENFSPPFGYRIGLQERIPREQLVGNINGENEIRFPANNRYGDIISAGTRITPLKNITVDLDWSASISNTVTENITVGVDGLINSTTTESGSYTTSVWAFGAGYEDFFERQLEAAYGDIVEGSNVLRDSLGNDDGRSVLNRNTLQDDFRKAYLGGGSTGRGDKGFLAFPLPQWRINWTQFEKYIPFLGKYMSTATLAHAYRGTYKVDWSLNAVTGLQSGKTLGSFSVLDERGLYEPSSIRVEQRFSPLAKLNVTWKSNLRTELGYDRGNISSFAINSNRVTETLTRGIDFGVNYTFRNVKISFLPKIKNNIEMGIRGSYKNDTENSFKLDTDLSNALANQNQLPDPGEALIDSKRTTEQKRLNGSFTLGYQISKTISSNFEYTFSRIESNQIPTRTNHDIRFNVRIAIRSR